MAVYTPLTPDDIREFLSLYDIGELVSAEGISEGIENTNYLLTINRDGTHVRFILTIFERRVTPGDLPFFMALTEFLANHGIPCPRPVQGNDYGTLNVLKGKPAALIEFLEGKNKPDITPEHLSLLGGQVARMHMAVQQFPLKRINTMSMEAWVSLLGKVGARADEIAPGLAQEIASELAWLQQHSPRGLPIGVIHADIFPDNVFFNHDEKGALHLSGIIDFYFACTDYLMYDLMICINAWCFDSAYHFVPERAQAFWQAYERVRPITQPEREAAGLLARAAAIRFLATRSYDWLNRISGAQVVAKDPMEYVEKLHFHQKIKDFRNYGL